MKPLLRFLSSVAESNFRRLKRPYKLNFCVTYRCQSRCLTCDIWKMKPEGEMSLEEIQRFAKENPYFDWVQFTGGEPFLRKDIVEIVKAFKTTSDPYIVSIPTNSLCAPEFIENQVRAILDLGVNRFALTLSLDGTRLIHDHVRGRVGNFSAVMELYGRLKQVFKTQGKMLVFGYTISKFNQGSLSDTVQQVKKWYPGVTYDDFHVNVAQNSPNYYRNQDGQIAPDPKIAASEIRAHLSRKKAEGAWPFVENRYLKGLVHFEETGESPLPSREGEVSVFMDSWGVIYPSIMSDSKLGDIRASDYSLERIMKSAKDPPASQHWTSCEAYQTVLGHLI